MLVHKATCIIVCAVLLICCLCGYQEQDRQQQLQLRSLKQQAQESHVAGTAAYSSSSSNRWQERRTTAYSTAAYRRLFSSGWRSARALLGIHQSPDTSQTAPPGSSSTADQLTIPIDSADLEPNLNPFVINATRPPAAPTPAATSAAAAEAAAGANWTGPSVKSVEEVRQGDSCVCWSPSTCTCGWQSCPYKPPDQAAVLPSDSARTLFGQDVLPQLQLSNDAQGAQQAPPLTQSMLRRFNKRISTQLINPLYQFTSEHYVLEGAREVIAAGGESYKFNLANLDARGNAISNVRTPLDMVRSPSLPYAAVFDLPLSMFFFWVFPDYSKPYEQTYELAVYLLQKYAGTDKHFFVGMWEGDHALRKPGNLGHNVPPDVTRMEIIQNVVQEKQRAVDNAKKDFGDACQHVYVWNYIEANFVLESIWQRNKISIINWLVPTIDNPPVDYISYSAYEVLFSGDWKLTNLTAAYDYMAERMLDKPGVPGPRVFLGEWAYPMYDTRGKPAWNMQESREKGLYAAAVSIAWGSQFNQYWQLYSNHRLYNGTGDRGFWLVLPNRKDSPIWASMKDYFAASDIFLQRFWACYGGWPSDYTYRVWAVKTLMKLVNNPTKPEPVVRELGSTNYGRQARVVADNTFGRMGPTITFTVSGETPAVAATQGSNYIPVSGTQRASGTSGRRRRRRSSISSSSSSSRQDTPPLIPQFLPGGGGDRGRCPIALPMISAGVPVPPKPAAGSSNSSGSGTAAAGIGINSSGSGTAAAGAAGSNSGGSGTAAAGGAGSSGSGTAATSGAGSNSSGSGSGTAAAAAAAGDTGRKRRRKSLGEQPAAGGESENGSK